jgi:hypothetical protein
MKFPDRLIEDKNINFAVAGLAVVNLDIAQNAASAKNCIQPIRDEAFCKVPTVGESC